MPCKWTLLRVRFTQDWEEDIIDQSKAANNEMAVLSTYLFDLYGAIDEETQHIETGRSSIAVQREL